MKKHAARKWQKDMVIWNMKTQADFQEKLNILTAILFPDPTSADTGPEILPPVPEGADHETLLCFGRALARHREFLKGPYEIFLPEEAEISGDILTIAREQQGVCAYGLDLPSGKVLYLDSAGAAEPLDLSLEDFLLYLTALQSTGFCPCSGRIEGCRKLLKEKFSDRRITDTSEEGAVYCFEEDVVLAVSGNDAYASARNDAAMEAFEKLRGLEVDYF